MADGVAAPGYLGAGVGDLAVSQAVALAGMSTHMWKYLRLSVDCKLKSLPWGPPRALPSLSESGTYLWSGLWNSGSEGEVSNSTDMARNPGERVVGTWGCRGVRQVSPSKQ